MEDWEVLTFRSHVAISDDGHTLIISNLVDGVNMYSIPPREPLCSFHHPINQNVPLFVSAMPSSSLFVVGSDNGCPCLYDQHTRHLSDILHHGKGTSSCYFHIWIVDTYPKSISYQNGHFATGQIAKMTCHQCRVHQWAQQWCSLLVMTLSTVFRVWCALANMESVAMLNIK